MHSQQVSDVAVQVLQLAQVDLVALQVVGQGHVQGHEVLEVHPQDGQLEPGAVPVHTPVRPVVAAGRQQVRQFAQRLWRTGERGHRGTRLYQRH